MLAGGHGAVILLGPPFLRLLHFDLGVLLEQGGELLCLYLSAGVGSVDLIVLPRAVQGLDQNGCVLVVTIDLYMTIKFKSDRYYLGPINPYSLVGLGLGLG